MQTRVDSRVAARVVTFGLHWCAARVDSRVASRVATRGQPQKLSTGYAQADKCWTGGGGQRMSSVVVPT